VYCHPDPKQGCPHSARALSAAGHLLNTEDLGVQCYEICADGMNMVRCADGWKVLGACDTLNTPRRSHNATRRARPALFGQPIRQPKTREPDFSHIKAAGRALSDVSALARIRAMYYTETGDWDGTWAHSRATDKIPIFRKFESMVRSLSPVNHAKPVVPGPKRRVLETLVSNCDDPTMTSCCSGACIPAGATCPAINPVSITQVWCQAINSATDDVNNFDMGAFLASIINCVQNYDNNPDTNPFGPDAATSQVKSYCWPMRGPQSWGFGGISLNFKGWLLSLCGGELAAGQQCSCPMYSCVFSCGVLTQDQERRLRLYAAVVRVRVHLQRGPPVQLFRHPAAHDQRAHRAAGLPVVHRRRVVLVLGHLPAAGLVDVHVFDAQELYKLAPGGDVRRFPLWELLVGRAAHHQHQDAPPGLLAARGRHRRHDPVSRPHEAQGHRARRREGGPHCMMSVTPNPVPVSFCKDGPNFLGPWFEIARLPFEFDSFSGSNVIVEFTALVYDVVTITMVRRVYGLSLVTRHKALVLNHRVNTKFFLTTGDVRNFWILRTDCTTYAMCGSPNRKRLSIYSREPTMDRDLYRLLLKWAKGMGYDTKSMVVTSHRPTFFPSGEFPTSPIPEHVLDDEE
jgi:lipocalin